ncbi:MerR family transcriptional regulator [Hydrogenophaga sp. BPS33]|uniref:MerR family transcriptional regulator n=1 Tax=Hydrogenophaga sp. BPS33 TaxID=2651974 RepID=UPI00131F8485|nr:cobalamin-dependent protein [Hydrogenophaga sp. BPS33]QHE84650.1 MerR family transcriptional regulator [Hydrogenophaga sp. BPS33]
MNSPPPLTAPTTSVSGDTGLPIATVERETGLGKDTLRAWERRYGFPMPSRNSSGDRLYSAEHVQLLRMIVRLLDTGLRPGKVVGLDHAALQTLLARQTPTPRSFLSKTNKSDTTDNPIVEELLHTIGSHDPRALRQGLSHAQLRMGLAPFVIDLVAPLTTAVGEAWAQGRFEVFEEHLYTEVITGVLRHAIASLPSLAVPQGPKVLLTTVPQEQHSLGLLMVEALLALESCTCVSLGTQTPLTDIAEAARAHQADVVALSFSSLHKAAIVRTSLRELRARLPASTALWVGGACPALYPSALTGVSAVRHLSGLQPLVAQWRHTH